MTIRELKDYLDNETSNEEMQVKVFSSEDSDYVDITSVLLYDFGDDNDNFIGLRIT